jgi:hypothetical protein
MMRKFAALIAAAAALGLAPRHASAQQLVTCESMNGNRQICNVNTAGGVAINRQLSGTSCIQGRTWGYVRNAIWVSNGCRAQFVVNPNGQYNSGQYGSGRYGNGRYDNGYDNNGVGYNTNEMRNLERACQRAVRAQVGRRPDISTEVLNRSRNNARIGFTLSDGRTGECRIDRNGNVTLRANRFR